MLRAWPLRERHAATSPTVSTSADSWLATCDDATYTETLLTVRPPSNADELSSFFKNEVGYLDGDFRLPGSQATTLVSSVIQRSSEEILTNR